MAASKVITFLPNEIIEYILESNDLGVKDVTKFALTCKHLYKNIMNNNKLWRTKFFQRYPMLKDAYEECQTQGLKIGDWAKKTRLGMQGEIKLLEMLQAMSPKNYRKEELSHSDFKQFDQLFCSKKGTNPMAYHFISWQLISIIKQNPNLTVQYYALKVLRYVRQTYLTEEWNRFIALPPEKQLLEKGVTLVAQWSQPEKDVPYWYIRSSLDDIAELTKALLKTRHPTHSIFSVSAEQLDLWRQNDIDDNQWSPSETRQVLDVLCEVLFVRLGFHGSNDMFYSSENSFIDCVLETRQGLPIILAIVFESVARRLGIKCEPISFPAHFLLRWKESYSDTASQNVENFYIDVFNGDIITKSSCPRIGEIKKCPVESKNIRKAATAIQVVDRMATNLEVAARQHHNINGRAARLRSVLELRYMIRPRDTHIILQLGRFYMLHHVDLSNFVRELKIVQKELEAVSKNQTRNILRMLQVYQKHIKPEESVVAKKRSPNVMYAVGMVMRYRNGALNEPLGVITGWELCAESNLRAARRFDQVNHEDDDEDDDEEDDDNQPRYSLFIDGGSSLYIAQGFLLPAVPVGLNSNLVNHCNIGRYFRAFNGRYYVPNEEKEREYPEDKEVRENWVF